MECPYWRAELIYEDSYGRKKYAEHYWNYPQGWIDIIGDILICPNRETFENLELAEEYKNNNSDLKDTPLEEICCDSACFNGFFYTDSNGNLHEGYPC